MLNKIPNYSQNLRPAEVMSIHNRTQSLLGYAASRSLRAVRVQGRGELARATVRQKGTVKYAGR